MAVDPKDVKTGDVLYYLVREGNKYSFRFGIVDSIRGDEAVIIRLTFDRKRKIDGVPVEEMDFPTPWKKLPKGWTWYTQLFKLDVHGSWEDAIEADYILSLDDPDSIKKAYADGYLIPLDRYDNSEFETEIDKNHGWRIVRKYDKYEPSYTAQYFSDCYSDFKEMKAFVKAYEDELKRQSELSDCDWSVEQIDKTLNRFAFTKGLSFEEKKRYRDWILSHEHVEDIEVRFIGDVLEWKYWNRKKWLAIEI